MTKLKDNKTSPNIDHIHRDHIHSHVNSKKIWVMHALMLHCVSYENSITVSKWENGSRWGAISISWVRDPVSCHQHDPFSDYRFCYVRLISNCITIKVNVRPWREGLYSITLARFCDLDDVNLGRVKGENWDTMCLLLQLKSLMIF